MTKLFFTLVVLLSTQVFAISRVVNCRDSQTNNLELQIVLRGGMATLNVCPKDVCSENDLEYAQTLMLLEDQSQTLQYGRISGKGLPVKQTLDLTFNDNGTEPVRVLIDQVVLGLYCY